MTTIESSDECPNVFWLVLTPIALLVFSVFAVLCWWMSWPLVSAFIPSIISFTLVIFGKVRG